MEDWQDDNEELGPSKSALKRQMTALQKLGEALVELSDKELAKIPIDDERLLETIHEDLSLQVSSCPDPVTRGRLALAEQALAFGL